MFLSQVLTVPAHKQVYSVGLIAAKSFTRKKGGGKKGVGASSFGILSRSLKCRVSASDIFYTLLTETLSSVVTHGEEIHPDSV